MPKIRELLTRWSFKGDTSSLKRFNQGLTASKKVAVAGAKALAGVAVAGVGAGLALFGLTKAAAGADDRVGKLSDRLDVDIEMLTGLKHAAELSGAELTDLGDGLKDLSIKAGEAFSDKKSPAAKYFKELGVSVADADGKMKSVDLILLEVAEGMSKVESGAKRMQIGNQLMGGSTVKLMPMLRAGADGIAGMMNEARDLGIVLDETGKKNAADFNDALLRVEGGVKGVALGVLRGLTPAITGYLKKAQDWILANRKMIQTKIDSFIKRVADYLGGIDWVKVAAGAENLAGKFLKIAEFIADILLDADKLEIALYALGAVTLVTTLGNLALAIVNIGKGAMIAAPALKSMLLFAGPLGIALGVVAVAAGAALKSYQDLIKAKAELLLTDQKLAGLNRKGEGGAVLAAVKRIQDTAGAPAFLRKAGAGPAFLTPGAGTGRGGAATVNAGGFKQENHFHGPVDSATTRRLATQTQTQIGAGNRALLEGVKR